jgi:hypothetical protein
MMIKRVGGGPPVAGPDNVEGPKASNAQKAAFGGLTSARAEAAPGTSAESAAVHRAVSDVASRVASGETLTPSERVDAVIERMVELRLGEETRPAVLRERVADARAVLGDHPTFAAHVGKLLDEALSALD